MVGYTGCWEGSRVFGKSTKSGKTSPSGAEEVQRERPSQCTCNGMFNYELVFKSL